MSSGSYQLIGLALGTVAGLVCLHNCQQRRSRKLRVEGIYIYPVKGCRGHSVQRAEVGCRGLKDDRMYMIVDKDRSFYTQRQNASLTQIHPDMPTEAGITLRMATGAAGPSPLLIPRPTARHICEVTIWDDKVMAEDQGDVAAKWLGDALGRDDLRLVRFCPDVQRQTDPSFGQGETGFADGFPILLTTEASIQDLAARVDSVKIGIDRFRTNLHVSGCRPWEEDEMPSVEFRGVRLLLVKPCGRCQVPSLHQRSGARASGGEPTRTLRGFRSGRVLARIMSLHRSHFAKAECADEVFFGQNATPRFDDPMQPRVFIEVGDVCYGRFS